MSSDMREWQNPTAGYPIYIQTVRGAHGLCNMHNSNAIATLAQKMLDTCNDGTHDVDDVPLLHCAAITRTHARGFEMRQALFESLRREYSNAVESDAQNHRRIQCARRNLETAYMVQISTMHTFCENIMRKYGVYAAIPTNFTVSRAGQQRSEQMQTIARFAAPYRNRAADILPQRDLIQLIFEMSEHCKAQRITFNERVFLQMIGGDISGASKYALAQICGDVISQMNIAAKESNAFAQQDLTGVVADMLCADEIARIVARDCGYIFVDGRQDCEVDVFRIFKYLSAAGAKVFIAVDDGACESHDKNSQHDTQHDFYRQKEIIDTYKLLNAMLYSNDANDANFNELLFTDYYKSISACKEDIDFRGFLEALQRIQHEAVLTKILDEIYERSLILDYYTHKGRHDARRNLLRLKEEARRLMHRDCRGALLIDFVRHLDGMIEHDGV